MKKGLFLAVSLLSISSALCFTGCNQNGDGDGKSVEDYVRTKIVTLDETDDGNGSGETDENGGNCPDGNCERHGMPKVHFEFKNGRPASKRNAEGEDKAEERGLEKSHGRHHGKHHRLPKHPRPAPPEDGGQDDNG
ncbi:MAG: hypothetical protein K2O89_01050 [Clostridia bacterium]|nr:hypothetical protein [Clostridia bacterium]